MGLSQNKLHNTVCVCVCACVCACVCVNADEETSHPVQQLRLLMCFWTTTERYGTEKEDIMCIRL